MEQIEISNAANEVLSICEYINPKFVAKIPTDFMIKLKELATNSNNCIKIDINKKLSEQEISETGKDLITLIYYSYLATEEEKQQLQESWNKNDSIYAEYIKQKYDPNNIFKKQENVKNDNKEIIEYKKNFITRILEKLRNKFKS
ncbi:unknown [Clostridium sp. CAG:354]|jgi:hypothetical protein|nr:hypothetical protein [Clostridium sp.]MBS5863076.1 hypothetical protein [Clostridium sp.]MEE0269116.1 hypothetical protein [Clostridia bacterium]CDE09996.1 unknown [Clostridium sp. CAG:354]